MLPAGKYGKFRVPEYDSSSVPPYLSATDIIGTLGKSFIFTTGSLDSCGRGVAGVFDAYVVGVTDA